MKLTIAVIFACLLLASIASSAKEEAKESGDWLSGGYVVTHHYPVSTVSKWGPSAFYSAYYDSAVFDPWYRNVAWPYLSNWYWPPSYYRSGMGIYPAYYNYPAYYWYSPVWRFPIYP